MRKLVVFDQATLDGYSVDAKASMSWAHKSQIMTRNGIHWWPVTRAAVACAIAEIHGANAALDAMPAIVADGRLAEYQPYWAARAELLAKTGAHGEALRAYEIAIGLERDACVRRFLQQRQSALAP
jgi:predicted RNA polymerase sigma factor